MSEFNRVVNNRYLSPGTVLLLDATRHDLTVPSSALDRASPSLCPHAPCILALQDISLGDWSLVVPSRWDKPDKPSQGVICNKAGLAFGLIYDLLQSNTGGVQNKHSLFMRLSRTWPIRNGFPQHLAHTSRSPSDLASFLASTLQSAFDCFHKPGREHPESILARFVHLPFLVSGLAEQIQIGVGHGSRGNHMLRSMTQWKPPTGNYPFPVRVCQGVFHYAVADPRF